MLTRVLSSSLVVQTSPFVMMPHKFSLHFSLLLRSGSGYPITYQILVVMQMYDRYWKNKHHKLYYLSPNLLLFLVHGTTIHPTGWTNRTMESFSPRLPPPPPHMQLRPCLVSVLSKGSPVASSVHSCPTVSMAPALAQALITCHLLCEQFPDWSFTSMLSAISLT